MSEHVVLKDNAFLQMLMITAYSHAAAEKIYAAIGRAAAGEQRLLPMLRPYDPIGSTGEVDFQTTRTVYETVRSHVNYLVEDSGWESKVGYVLDHLDSVESWMKNTGILRIPYTHEGTQGHYIPDFVARIRDGHDDLLNLVIEVTGERRKDKVAKVDAARTFWIPAVNNQGQYGRWDFLEVTDPEDAANLIRSSILTRISA